MFTWRRQARRSAAGTTENAAPNFVPAVVVETALPAGGTLGRRRKRTRHVAQISGLMEVEIAGMTVRIGRGADAETVAAVLRTLKAGT